jgi:two-component system, sensor histidine kinase PdtaS
VYTRLHLQGAAVELDAKEFLEDLCRDLSETVIGLRPIAITTEIEPLQLDSQTAVTLGLVVNELITNALKYAFPDGDSGEIRIKLRRTNEGYDLEQRDNGVGASMPKDAGSGMKLVRGMVGQMRGRVDWTTEEGTRVSIRLPA